MAGSLRFRHRIVVLVALAGIALVAVTVVTLVLGRDSERQLTGIETRYVPLIELDRDLKTSFAAIPRAFEDAASAADEGQLERAIAAAEQFAQQLATAAPVITVNGGDPAVVQAEFRTYYLVTREISAALAGGTPPEQLAAKITMMQRAREAFTSHLDAATTPDRARLAAAFATARESYRTAFLVDIAVAIAALAVMGLASWTLIRSTVKALRAVSLGVERLARGEFGERIEVATDDELGALAREANRTAGRLLEYREAAAREDWIKSGIGGLGTEIAGEQDTATLGRKAMTYLAKYLGAEVAVAYVGDDGGTFRRLDTYGAAGTPEVPETFRIGESVLGQAARDDEIRVIDDVPSDYLTVRSALGRMAPRCVLIAPFSHEGRTMGVLELALRGTPTEQALELIRRTRSALGVAFRVAESRQHAQTLLDETQRQAEELRHAYDTLESRNATLLTAQRLLEDRAAEIARASRYKSEFLANMSHELRTPLNSVMILSKLLAENDDRADKRVEFANLIHKSGEELLVLINDVLDLSKVEAGKQVMTLEPVELAELAGYARRMFAPLAAQQQLGFEVEVARELPAAIRTDRTRLHQIVKNLVSNALKFTERGRVTVTISAAAADAIAIAVSDTGIGIAADKRAVIFEAFAQADGGTSRKYGGTGLGLTIARELAQRLGGRLDVDSELGVGSTFRVVLPIAGPGSPDAPVGDPASAPLVDDRAELARGEACMLVIEDDRGFAAVVLHLIRGEGFKGLVAGDGRDGLELAKRSHPSGIILDVGLPDMDGWAVLEALKRDPATRAIPVHFVTAADDAERAYRMGAVGLTKKPATPAQVRSALQALDHAARAGLRRVLLVESDPVARGALRALLTDAELEVDVAASSAEAFVRLADGTHACVVTNIAIPGKAEGFALIDRVRADVRLSTLPIVVHTGRELDAADVARLEADERVVVVLEGVRSKERVLDETRLFVHRIRTEQRAPRISTAVPVGDREPGVAGPDGQNGRDGANALDGKTILIVDDDMRNVYSLSSALRAHQLRVLTASDGQEALDELARHPDAHAVLMDVMMPGMDGHEATRRIRAQSQFANLPIIALTAKTMPGEREKCLDAGANDYMPKPIDLERLIALLRVWLA